MKLNNLLLLVIASSIYTIAFAQPTVKHQKTIGGNDDDELTCMALSRDSGLIVGGLSYSNISYEKSENSRGEYDYWIVKLDRLGRTQWDKTIGGNGGDALYSLEQTRDGGYILGGQSKSGISGEKTEEGWGWGDYWIVKLDGFGNIQWDKTIGGDDLDNLSSLQQTRDGGYILGGYSYSNISGEKTENSRGGSDYWIVKLDGSGNIQWDKTIGGSLNDDLTDLQQTSDGGYILGGSSYSNISGEKTEYSRGKKDYWVVKLDSLGEIQWDKTIGGADMDNLTSLIQTSTGDYIMGGTSFSGLSGDKTERKRGFWDIWIVKLSKAGNILWDKTIGGSDNDGLSVIDQTADGGYIISGYSGSNISGEKTENSKGGWDYWVVKLDAPGNIQWDKTVGGSSDDAVKSIKEIAPNHYILGGYSYSDISGDKTQRNRDSVNLTTDYWLVELKYKPQNDIAVISAAIGDNAKLSEANTARHFTIYPNPAKDILHIQTNGKATFTLTNQSGKVLLTKTITNKGEINVANLVAGLYYLKNNTTGAVQKVVVTK